MKKIQIKIDQTGNYSIDMLEGFSGMSCEQKADQIAIICGGVESERKEKPEFYDSEDMFEDTFNDSSY